MLAGSVSGPGAFPAPGSAPTGPRPALDAVPKGPARGIIRDAFAAWERVCGVDFVEVPDSIDTDVRIGWTSAAQSDGPGGTLAYFGPWTWAGTGAVK